MDVNTNPKAPLTPQRHPAGKDRSKAEVLFLVDQLDAVYQTHQCSLSCEDSLVLASLPAELLISIFRYVLEDNGMAFHVTDPEDSAQLDVTDLVQLTHVCQLWRDVAVRYSPFWSRIHGAHRDMLDVSAARSRGMPLTLLLSTEKGDATDILTTYGSRLQKLHLTISSEYADVRPLLRFTPKTLECLTITYSDLSDQPESPLGQITLFSQSVLPSLKALAIEPMASWIPANSFPQLTHLLLVLSMVRETPDPIDLLKLISNLPQLEFLYLYGLAPSDRATEFSNQISCPFLRSVTFICGCMHTATAMLTTMIIPPAAYVCLDNVYVFEDAPPLLPHLSVVDGISRIEVATDGYLLHLVAESSNSGLWLQGQFEGNHNGDDQRSWATWFSTLDASLPLDQVTSLSIFVGGDCDALLAFLSSMPCLNEVSVRFNPEWEDDPDRSVVRSLYAFLQDPANCAKLKLLTIDINANGAQEHPPLYTRDLMHMVRRHASAHRSLHQVTLQPFTDGDEADKHAFSEVAEELSRFSNLANVVQLRQPGPAAGEFRQRACWNLSDASKYWTIDADSGRPSYKLPWKME
ncbi:hypothetical protein C8Q80DRAFT_1275521 [Daedaleopsis nitida]|nr:hypothetical protein C8Q80DRAFT_1275521 [Daedaleopsis nitida]